MKRLDVTFSVGGDHCAAWLYLPEQDGPFACVVMGHGFTGVREAGLAPFATAFAEAGLACLVFDYRHFGDSKGEPRQLLDISRQLADFSAAVEYARTRPEVDAGRVGIWGTSFSGGHVLRLAAHDSSIRAVVAQAPFIDGLVNARAAGWRQGARLFLAACRDGFRRAVGRTPYYVPAAGEPGELAAMTTPDALPGFKRLEPPGGCRFDVAARIFLHLPFYRPGKDVSRVKCPILFCLAEQDAVTPIAAAEKAARRARRSEIAHFPVGHFEVYFNPTFATMIERQIAFYRRELADGC